VQIAIRPRKRAGGRCRQEFHIAECFIDASGANVVVDVGANVGFTSAVWLLERAREVYSFEPNDAVFKSLQGFSEDYPQVRAHHMALGNTRGTVELTISTKHDQGSTLNIDTMY